MIHLSGTLQLPIGGGDAESFGYQVVAGIPCSQAVILCTGSMYQSSAGSDGMPAATSTRSPWLPSPLTSCTPSASDDWPTLAAYGACLLGT